MYHSVAITLNAKASSLKTVTDVPQVDIHGGKCNIAVWLSLFWVTVERIKVFSRLKQEKLRSAVQFVTDKVIRNKTSATA